MFSKKFQEDLYIKKYKSMKQLDRLEFQNNRNIQNNRLGILSMFLLSLLLIEYLSLLSFMSYSVAYQHLLSLGYVSNIYLEAVIGMGFNVVIIATSFIFCLYSFVKTRYKYKLENEKFLEENIK